MFVNQSVFAYEELEYEFSESDFPSHFPEDKEMTRVCGDDLVSGIGTSRQKRCLSSLYTGNAKQFMLDLKTALLVKFQTQDVKLCPWTVTCQSRPRERSTE